MLVLDGSHDIIFRPQYKTLLPWSNIIAFHIMRVPTVQYCAGRCQSRWLVEKDSGGMIPEMRHNGRGFTSAFALKLPICMKP